MNAPDNAAPGLRFPPLLAAFVIGALAILCSLGTWQLQRLQWKRDLIARVDARLASAPISFDAAMARAAKGEDMEYQPVEIAGVFRHDAEAHVFGVHEGAAGVFVFTPLETAGAGLVYVNRGFMPQSMNADRANQPMGEVRVAGLLRRAERASRLEAALKPKDQPEDNLFFRRDPERLASARGLAVSPVYVDSFGRESPGDWPKGGLTRVEFPNRHLEYALTWFGLAAALIGVFLAYSIRRT
jgi:surfeit locus 1 family protein